MKRLIFLLLFLLLPAFSWAQVGAVYYVDAERGADTSTGDRPGSELKSMVGLDKLMTTMKSTDKIIIKGLPAWGSIVGETTTGVEGSIQYSLTSGNKWNTLIYIGKVKLTGVSTRGLTGEMETVINRKEATAVVAVEVVR